MYIVVSKREYMDEQVYNFDQVVDRSHTNASKIEEMGNKFGRRDLLPMWIADMDFEACPCIIDALRRRLDHAVLGYTSVPDEFWQSISDWLFRRHQWSVKCEELTFMPGLKKALSLCVNYFSKPGDGVVIQPPVYHSFRSVIEGNGRKVLNNPLIVNNAGAYEMDFAQLETLMKEECPAMMIVCNPHNPIGLQWDVSTLQRVASICRAHNVVLVSDEIYGDMMLGGERHVPTASVSSEAEAVTITLGSPSKTFNIPGIVSAWTVVKSPELREPFFNWLTASEFNSPPIAAMVATQAAYDYGEPWLDQALLYLQANVDFAADFLAREIPQVVMYRPEASFAIWLDFRKLNLSQEELVKRLICRGRLALSDGASFGVEGRGFMRMNVGVPRVILAEGLRRLKVAIACDQAKECDLSASIPFVVMQGLGNKFVFIDCMERSIENLSALAMEMSRRHTGFDTDGIIAIMPSDVADCRMRIFNSDGSEAQMCGNGIRCVAKYVSDNRIVTTCELTVETLSGVKHLRVHAGVDGMVDSVTVDMGLPQTAPAAVPVDYAGERMVDEYVEVGQESVRITAVSMGNPHGVVFVDNYVDEIVQRLGPMLECHSIWPERANIEFVRVDASDTLSVRTWERGAGETMACGTGACAAAVAAVLTKRAEWPLTVRLVGGNLHIDCDCSTGHILMTGPAVTLYCGTYYPLACDNR